ncbi:MAG: VWA domain-containing protein [Verrucomicrobiae bacterium]|nr:VWA domain-containing protein [Verrucomicrobiae bacterium]
MIEVLLVVAVIGVVAAIALPRFGNIGDQTQTLKLKNDVSSINRSIDLYYANGGSLDSCKTADEVISKLKTTRAASEAKVFVGHNGSPIDPRLTGKVLVNENSTVFRAKWNPGNHRFELGNSGPGIEKFSLDDTLAEVDFGTESREQSALTYNPDEGWIWTYKDRQTAPQIESTIVTVSSVPNSPPPPSTVAPVQLRPPVISPGSGTRPATSFPFPVEISNPNASDTTIRVSINSGVYQAYTGPISIEPGTSIRAYVTGDPARWISSAQSYAAYRAAPPVLLDPPAIFLSSPIFNETTDEITISILDSNPSGIAELQFTVFEAGGSPPPQSSWNAYTGATTVDVTTYPNGFEVQAFSKAINPLHYHDSRVASAGATAEFFGVPTSGDVLFLIDASGSMNSSYAQGNGQSRFDAVIEALISTINRLASSQNFSVVTFDSDVAWTDGSWALKPATAPNKQAMIASLQTEVAGKRSGTNYEAAFAAATRFTPNPTRVIFLTDGNPTSDTYSDEIEVLASMNISVDSIGIDLDANGLLRLEEIAIATDGVWVNLEKAGP